MRSTLKWSALQHIRLKMKLQCASEIWGAQHAYLKQTLRFTLYIKCNSWNWCFNFTTFQSTNNRELFEQSSSMCVRESLTTKFDDCYLACRFKGPEQEFLNQEKSIIALNLNHLTFEKWAMYLTGFEFAFCVSMENDTQKANNINYPTSMFHTNYICVLYNLMAFFFSVDLSRLVDYTIYL